MLKILRVALPQESVTERVFLGELLQSARWLGWEMPTKARSEVLSEQVREGQAEHFPTVHPHGEPA